MLSYQGEEIHGLEKRKNLCRSLSKMGFSLLRWWGLIQSIIPVLLCLPDSCVLATHIAFVQIKSCGHHALLCGTALGVSQDCLLQLHPADSRTARKRENGRGTGNGCAAPGRWSPHSKILWVETKDTVYAKKWIKFLSTYLPFPEI